MGHREDPVREAVIMRHAGMVRAIARRYRGRGIADDDLVQAGYLGLIQAVDRFDPSRGIPLGGYAARMIEGEILHQFRDLGWALRMPRSLQDLSRRAARAGERLAGALGREPSTAELAEALDEDPVAVEHALAARNASRGAVLATEASDDPAEPAAVAAFDAVDERDLVVRALRALPVRERRILIMRFHQSMTQAEIAERLGISQMHVSRLLRTSLDLLRERMAAA